jgi:hypothetical protein
MNSPRCNAAQNGCTTSETIELLNAINNTPINECCNHRRNPRIPKRTGLRCGRVRELPFSDVSRGALGVVAAVG